MVLVLALLALIAPAVTAKDPFKPLVNPGTTSGTTTGGTTTVVTPSTSTSGVSGIALPTTGMEAELYLSIAVLLMLVGAIFLSLDRYLRLA